MLLEIIRVSKIEIRPEFVIAEFIWIICPKGLEKKILVVAKNLIFRKKQSFILIEAFYKNDCEFFFDLTMYRDYKWNTKAKNF